MIHNSTYHIVTDEKNSKTGSVYLTDQFSLYAGAQASSLFLYEQCMQKKLRDSINQAVRCSSLFLNG